MKKALLFMAVLGLLTAAAQANIVQTYVATRDDGMNKAKGDTWDESWSNAGKMTSVRFAKGRQHYLLVDFDWDAIKSWVAQYQGVPGVTIKYEFSIMISASPTPPGMNGLPFRVLHSCNTVDWVEGDGNSMYAAFSWSTGTVAATSHYAQTNKGDPTYPIVDPGGAGPWPWGDFDGLRDQLWMYNGAVMVGKPVGERAWVTLSPWFAKSQLDGVVEDNLGVPVPGLPPIVGMYTYDWGGFYFNDECFTREAGDDKAPLIRVTIIPEPASLLLVVLGGLGLLARRRR